VGSDRPRAGCGPGHRTADAPDDAAVIVTALLDAREVPGLQARPLALLAAQASSTVQLRFDGVSEIRIDLLARLSA
jgi:hypothetical protein